MYLCFTYFTHPNSPKLENVLTERDRACWGEGDQARSLLGESGDRRYPWPLQTRIHNIISSVDISLHESELWWRVADKLLTSFRTLQESYHHMIINVKKWDNNDKCVWIYCGLHCMTSDQCVSVLIMLCFHCTSLTGYFLGPLCLRVSIMSVFTHSSMLSQNYENANDDGGVIFMILELKCRV